MTQQLTIDDAIAAGEHHGAHCLSKAERSDPEFSARAEAAMLAHLRAVGSCSGEDLTTIARAKGAVPHDDRAFGPVFKSMARRGLIRCVGFCLRKRGHGTAGGRIWGIGG
jgi:hypothetical protein